MAEITGSDRREDEAGRALRELHQWVRAMSEPTWWVLPVRGDPDRAPRAEPLSVRLSDGSQAVVAFTSAGLATGFASQAGLLEQVRLGGPAKVLPRDLLAAGRRFQARGVGLVWLDPGSAGEHVQRFEVLAEVARAAKLWEGGEEGARGERAMRGQDGPRAGRREIAERKGAVRRALDEFRAHPGPARSHDLWAMLLGCERWYLLPRGEGELMRPYVGPMQDGASALLAWQDPADALAFARRHPTAPAVGDPHLLALAPGQVVEQAATYVAAGVERLWMDPATGFDLWTPLADLPELAGGL